jgi:hypothetical protein
MKIGLKERLISFTQFDIAQLGKKRRKKTYWNILKKVYYEAYTVINKVCQHENIFPRLLNCYFKYGCNSIYVTDLSVK